MVDQKKGPRHKVYYFDFHQNDFVFVATFRHIWDERAKKKSQYPHFWQWRHSVGRVCLHMWIFRCDMWCFECRLSSDINHLGRMNFIGFALCKVCFWALMWFQLIQTWWCLYQWRRLYFDIKFYYWKVLFFFHKKSFLVLNVLFFSHWKRHEDELVKRKKISRNMKILVNVGFMGFFCGQIHHNKCQ